MSSQNYASLAVLSYNRLEMMRRSLQSLRCNTPPTELIVVDDGSQNDVRTYLFQAMRDKRVSTLIMNAGANRGVGEGVRRAWAIATGAYLVKLDADLIYKPGWLEAGMWILDNMPDVAVVGWFDYRNYNPQDTRFNIIESRAGATVEIERVSATAWGGGVMVAQENPNLRVARFAVGIVDDFVSSAMMVRTCDYRDKIGSITTGSTAFAEDVVMKRQFQEMGYKLAITTPDMIENIGFGAHSTLFEQGHDGAPKVVSIQQGAFLV